MSVARKMMLLSSSALIKLKFRSWNFVFGCQIPLRGKSFGKVLEWHVVVKGLGLLCWTGYFLNFANSKEFVMFD